MSQSEFESVCKRCGVCCGSRNGDPCTYLRKDSENKYFCQIYPNRLGLRMTVKGNIFRCIPIEAAIHYPPIRQVCAYAKFFDD